MKAHRLPEASARPSRAAALFLPACALLVTGCAGPPEEGAADSARAGARTGGVDLPAESALRAEAGRLAADVAWLADDAREGRRAGTAGERAAGDWIAARLAELGLEPAGEDGWFQEFPVPLTPRDGGASRLVVGGDEAFGGSERLVPLFCSASGDVRGRTAFCGYGVIDAELGWDDFAEPEGDTLAVIVRGTPPFDVPAVDGEPARESGWAGAGSIQLKVQNARRRGYVGVLLVPHPDAEDQGLLAFDPARAGRAGIPALMVGGELAGLALGGYEAAVRALDASARPASELDWKRGAEVIARADVVREEASARNVLARLRGTAGGSTVVVGAHYDHLGVGGPGSLAPDDFGAVHNGADDNASGTAVVLELARLLVGAPPAGDVLFALWSGEELGLLGSEYWAEHPTVPWDSVAANVNLDMVGRADDGVVQVLGAGTSPAFAGWMDELGSHAGLELEVSMGGAGLGGSDHMSFLKREVPALFFFTGVHTDYHRPSDDASGFEADGARRVAELARSVVHRMHAAAPLAYVAPPREESGERRERGWSTWFGSVPAYSYDGPGVKFSGTQPDSPADRAGFLPGDILVGVGEIEIETIHDFVYALQVYKPGDVVAVRYLRDGDELEVAMTMGTRELE